MCETSCLSLPGGREASTLPGRYQRRVPCCFGTSRRSDEMCDFKKAVTILLLCVGVSSVASAQQVTSGRSEVVGLVGGVTDGGGFTVGGGVHYALDSKWIFVGELSYLTGGDDFSGSFQGIPVTAESSAITVDLNAHYLLQNPGKAPFAPYLLGGLGIIRARATATTLGITPDRKSTRLNSSHLGISYAVFSLSDSSPREFVCFPTRRSSDLGDDFSGSFQGIPVTAESSAITVDLNAHYLLQNPGKAPFAPYLLGGLGIIRARATATTLGIT